MISGKAFEELTLTNILKKVSEYDIYRHYLGHDFKPGVPFHSPFHDDRSPSFSIVPTSSGRLHFTDFGGEHKSGKIIDFLRHFYPGKNFHQILQALDLEFALGICSPDHLPATARTSNVSTYLTGVQQKLFQVSTRSFNSTELTYWNRYHIDLADLRRWDTFVPKALYIDKKRVPLPAGELVFAYLYEGQYWKIYRPHAPTKKEKWLSNVPHTCMYGLKELEEGRDVLATKAQKDFMMVKKIFTNVCGTQYEGTNVISEANIGFLQQRFPRVYVNFDPDPAGKAAMLHYWKNYRFRPLSVPRRLFQQGTKDLSEVGRRSGLDAVADILNRKISVA